MDIVFRSVRRLIFLLGVLPCLAVAQSMPAVTPISSVPIGPAPGGGVQTRVTYEMRLAANDASAAAAANDARYVSRAVTIAGPTMGGIVRGVVAGGSRLLPWVAAALTAYEVYKWYTDNGVLTQPGSAQPGATCLSGGPYFHDNGFGSNGCSVPGVVSRTTNYVISNHWNGAVDFQMEGCVPAQVGQLCTYSYSYHLSDGRQLGGTASIAWMASGSSVTSDPDVVIAPSPVTDQQLGDLAQQHPEWWPDMLRDPQTGQPLVTPEIADDMNALRHQIAPDYGVDPQTLADVQPDPLYKQGTADPRQQSLPQYCAWASEACDYYRFVEEHWPEDGKKQYADSEDCNLPPACSGDEVMCGVALQTFKLRCQFSGDGDPPDSGNHDVRELYAGDVDLGAADLDQSGFGLSTSCPFTNVSADYGGQSATVSLDFICTWGVGLRVLILLCAAVACAKIMGGVQTNT